MFPSSPLLWLCDTLPIGALHALLRHVGHRRVQPLLLSVGIFKWQHQAVPKLILLRPFGQEAAHLEQVLGWPAATQASAAWLVGPIKCRPPCRASGSSCCWRGARAGGPECVDPSRAGVCRNMGRGPEAV
eukprot:357149-Pelagomonas_calceolata.AAC.2